MTLKKNDIVEVTPVLRWNGGEAKSQPATFQGEKVQGNDQTIAYKAGGTYTMNSKEAADLINEIKPQIAVPHGDIFLMKKNAK